MDLRRHLMLLLVLLCFTATPVVAMKYDHDLLKIFSKILPRIVLMSSLSEPSKKSVSICILHEKLDQYSAETFTAMLKRSNVKTEIIVTSLTASQQCEKCQLAFLFNTDAKSFGNTLRQLNAMGLMSATYHANGLKHGADITLHIKRKVIPHINVQALQAKGITLNPMLYRVSKIYESHRP